MPQRIATLARRAADLARAYPLAILALLCLLPWLGLMPPVWGLATDPIGRIALGGILGYWTDRWIFPYARPHSIDDDVHKLAAEWRRALIVAACVLGACGVA